jgi:hypothetical protein
MARIVTDDPEVDRRTERAAHRERDREYIELPVLPSMP